MSIRAVIVLREIKITRSNAEKIMRLINAIQGKSTERVFYAYGQIESITDSVEKRLNVIPSRFFKKAVEGTEFLYDFRQHFPNAYKWKPYSSWIKCRYHNGTWRLVSFGREECPNINTIYPYKLMLSDSCKEAILKTYE